MRIAITGASGFVGRNLIALLLEDTDPRDIRALVRDAGNAAHELPRAGLDVRVVDVRRPETLRGTFDAIDAVVHTVAIPTERTQRFADVNAAGTRNVLAEAERAAVGRFVHMSALGAAAESPYPYLRSKGEGQAAVLGSRVPHVILRPSVLFGPGDDFFPRLGFTLRFPIVPLPDGGGARFQPLHVADLALVLRAALRRPELAGAHELGGPDPVTYRDLLREAMRAYRKWRPTMPVPVPLMKPAALAFELFMADPPVTREQLDLLAVDNRPHPNAIDQVFGIRPRPFVNGGLSYLS